jgi:hypothetical protein
MRQETYSVKLRRAARLACVTALVLVLAGCSGVRTATVKGTVTYNGDKVESGVITFFPVDGMTPTAGATITDGTYTARVPIGTVQVVINATKITGKTKKYPTAESPDRCEVEELLPARYNTRSELQLDVVEGVNDKDFQLKGK